MSSSPEGAGGFVVLRYDWPVRSPAPWLVIGSLVDVPGSSSVIGCDVSDAAEKPNAEIKIINTPVQVIYWIHLSIFNLVVMETRRTEFK